MFYQQKASAYETHTRVVMGNNCISQLPEELRVVKPNHVLVVTGKNVKKTPFYQKCLDYIAESGYAYTAFNQVEEEAPVRNIVDGVKIVHELGCDLLIAIGGGSAMDVCKGIAVLATNGGTIQQHKGYEQFHIRPIPFITIPTTAGTASEVTSIAIIHDEETHVKISVGHRELLCARVAFLDPQSLATCPRSVIAQSGIDALAHNF